MIQKSFKNHSWYDFAWMIKNYLDKLIFWLLRHCSTIPFKMIFLNLQVAPECTMKSLSVHFIVTSDVNRLSSGDNERRKILQLFLHLAVSVRENCKHACDFWTYLIFLNSSQSHRIRFMCLSKALKVPMKMRPSCRMHLILKSMCCSILLLFPTVWETKQNKHHNQHMRYIQNVWGSITEPLF